MAVLQCLKKAATRRRGDTVRLFAKVGQMSHGEARQLLRWGGAEYQRVARMVAEYLLEAYQGGRIRFETVKMKQVSDGSSGKVRAVAMIPVWQLMLDHIACAALADIFKRIGYNQYSGMPKRGAVAAVRKLAGWLRNPAMKYAAQMDAQKCYQSIDRRKLINWLAVKVKNPELLRLVWRLINTSPTPGLGIGSYLSQSLATLYLSEIYHEITERMARVRKSKRRGNKRVRLVHHCLFYMDDIILVGSNKRDLHRAVEWTIGKAAELGLTIKKNWRVVRVSGGGAGGQLIDTMGFRIGRGYVTVRRRVFLRARRVIMRAWQRIKTGRRVAVSQARKIISYAGYFKYSSSCKFSIRYHLPDVLEGAKNSISNHDKNHEKQSTIY